MELARAINGMKEAGGPPAALIKACMGSLGERDRKKAIDVLSNN